MIYSGYKLNKQDDNVQPWCTPVPVLNQSVVPHPFLTFASLPAYKFLKRQVRWSCIPISLWIFQFVVIHTVKGFCVVSEAEVVFFVFVFGIPLLSLWSNECWQFDPWSSRLAFCMMYSGYKLISIMTIYSLDLLLSQFWISLLFHICFCCFFACIQISQEAGKLVWYSHLFMNFPLFFVIHRVKGFCVISEAEVCFCFWNSFAFSTIQWMLAIWSLVPLPFLNPVYMSASSQFMYCWNLAWKILSITLLVYKMSTIVQ